MVKKKTAKLDLIIKPQTCNYVIKSTHQKHLRKRKDPGPEENIIRQRSPWTGISFTIVWLLKFH